MPGNDMLQNSQSHRHVENRKERKSTILNLCRYNSLVYDALPPLQMLC